MIHPSDRKSYGYLPSVLREADVGQCYDLLVGFAVAEDRFSAGESGAALRTRGETFNLAAHPVGHYWGGIEIEEENLPTTLKDLSANELLSIALERKGGLSAAGRLHVDFTFDDPLGGTIRAEADAVVKFFDQLDGRISIAISAMGSIVGGTDYFEYASGMVVLAGLSTLSYDPAGAHALFRPSYEIQLFSPTETMDGLTKTFDPCR